MKNLQKIFFATMFISMIVISGCVPEPVLVTPLPVVIPPTISKFSLILKITGTGSGNVAGAGMYDSGATATVTATANVGSTFTGWSDTDATACTTGSVTMTSVKSCIATFTLKTFALTLTTAGTGSGTVTGAGMYDSGATATVTANPSATSTFEGWEGVDAVECATGSVIMTASKSCTAMFSLVPVVEKSDLVKLREEKFIRRTATTTEVITNTEVTVVVWGDSFASGNLFYGAFDSFGKKMWEMLITSSVENSYAHIAFDAIDVYVVWGDSLELVNSRAHLEQHSINVGTIFPSKDVVNGIATDLVISSLGPIIPVSTETGCWILNKDSNGGFTDFIPVNKSGDNGTCFYDISLVADNLIARGDTQGTAEHGSTAGISRIIVRKFSLTEKVIKWENVYVSSLTAYDGARALSADTEEVVVSGGEIGQEPQVLNDGCPTLIRIKMSDGSLIFSSYVPAEGGNPPGCR